MKQKEQEVLLVKEIPDDGIIFYDIETDSQYCQYCRIRLMSYQLGVYSEPVLVEDWNREDFRKLLASDIMKVSFNGINFDDIVLMREGYYVNPENRHDMFLAIKTVAPMLPAFGLKFVNFHYFGDWHEPERKLHAWCKKNNKMMWEASNELLGNYCKHDVRQTCKVFRLIWEVVQREEHWQAYKDLELKMGEPLHEMSLFGGEYVSLQSIDEEIKKALAVVSSKKEEVYYKTEGPYQILNPLSVQQMTAWMDYMKPDRKKEFTPSGRESYVKANLLAEINESEDEDLMLVDSKETKEDKLIREVNQLVYDIREITKAVSYLRSFYEAGDYEQKSRDVRDRNFFVRQNSNLCVSDSTSSNDKRRFRRHITGNGQGSNSNISKELIKIPKSYSLSGARTRRFISSSRFGINFQNQNKGSKVAMIVPPGWLGVFIDSTQIENVVHIWASRDDVRRKDYELHTDWNEYVWLCCQVLGGNWKKEDLEQMKSEVNPLWSVYKQYKTGKLALNFGMGIEKFAQMTGLSIDKARVTFAQIHKACPAIHQLQEIVRQKLIRGEKIKDPWGHIYGGSSSKAYKVVSYLVQGCGTGSVPKAMTIACYDTIHSMDTPTCRCKPYLFHPYRHTYSYGCLCGTTHDELSLRISLGLPTEEIVQLIKDLMYNMEGRFSDRFGGIPLRAKLAVSITTAADQVELDHTADKFETKLVEDFIEVGKRKMKIL